MADYSKITQDWKRLTNGLPYKWVVDYAALNAYGNFELTSEDWEKRDYIVNFKGNSELTTEIDHQQALKKAILDITQLVKANFGEATQQLTLVCIPASTQANTSRRFEEFSQKVCQNTGMTNTYTLFTWNKAGDVCTIPYDALQGKDILLFDDIIASGGSVCRFSDKLTAKGANVIAAIALGKKL